MKYQSTAKSQSTAESQSTANQVKVLLLVEGLLCK